jgi:hypothetical protein
VVVSPKFCVTPPWPGLSSSKRSSKDWTKKAGRNCSNYSRHSKHGSHSHLFQHSNTSSSNIPITNGENGVVKVRKRQQLSYRIRRSRDLVSRKLLYSRFRISTDGGFRNDGLGTRLSNIEQVGRMVPAQAGFIRQYGINMPIKRQRKYCNVAAFLKYYNDHVQSYYLSTFG